MHQYKVQVWTKSHGMIETVISAGEADAAHAGTGAVPRRADRLRHAGGLNAGRLPEA